MLSKYGVFSLTVRFLNKNVIMVEIRTRSSPQARIVHITLNTPNADKMNKYTREKKRLPKEPFRV